MYAKNVRRFVSSLELLMSHCYNMLCGYKSGLSGVSADYTQNSAAMEKLWNIRVNGKLY